MGIKSLVLMLLVVFPPRLSPSIPMSILPFTLVMIFLAPLLTLALLEILALTLSPPTVCWSITSMWLLMIALLALFVMPSTPLSITLIALPPPLCPLLPWLRSPFLLTPSESTPLLLVPALAIMRMMRILALLLATLSLLLPILPLLLLSSSPILLLVSKLTLSLLPLSVVLAPLLSMKLDSNTLLTPFLPVFAELLSTSIMSKLPPKLFLLFVTWSTLVVPLLLLLLLLAEPCALLSTLSLLVPAPTMVPSLKMCVKVTLSTSPLVCALMSFVV